MVSMDLGNADVRGEFISKIYNILHREVDSLKIKVVLDAKIL